MDRSTLERKSVDDLREIAKQLDLTGIGRLRKAELIDTLIGEMNDDDGEQGDDGDEAGDSARDEVIERRRSRTRSRSNGSSNSNGDGSRDDSSDDADSGDDADSADEGDGNDDNGTGNGRTRARSRDRRKRSKGNRPSELDGLEEREGVLDLLPEGYGFLRTTAYVSGDKDVYVSQSYVRRFNLRRGDLLGGPVKFNKGNDKFPALARLETCEGDVVENEHDPILRDRPEFADLDVAFPDEQLVLGGGGSPVLRAIDAFAPLGRGQRALLLTPPAADAGALVRAIGGACADLDDVDVFVALIDARPEEISECERTLDAEVVGSPLDAPAEDHVAAAELVIERAKRLAERGRDVVVLFDSLSQLGRAYNLAGSSSGRSLPGGLDTGAIAPLKQLFGSARNIDGEGSLTLLALAGLDPDSDTDRTILDHLRGAGNAELRFAPSLGTDGELPALDIANSGTRRSEGLVGDDAARAAGEARSLLAQLDAGAAWALVAEHLGGKGDLTDLAEAARTSLGA